MPLQLSREHVLSQDLNPNRYITLPWNKSISLLHEGQRRDNEQTHVQKSRSQNFKTENDPRDQLDNRLDGALTGCRKVARFPQGHTQLVGEHG